MTQKVEKLDYHRNGVSGAPFHVAIVSGEQGQRMLVVRFEDCDEAVGQVVCAAFDIDKLAAGDIAFFSNSWRGDRFHEVVDAAIKAQKTAE